jgi:hypothetical protein
MSKSTKPETAIAIIKDLVKIWECSDKKCQEEKCLLAKRAKKFLKDNKVAKSA